MSENIDRVEASIKRTMAGWAASAPPPPRSTRPVVELTGLARFEAELRRKMTVPGLVKCRMAPGTKIGPPTGASLENWQPPRSLEWMPAGRHCISAWKQTDNGLVPWEGDVVADPIDAVRLNEQLQQAIAKAARGEASRPFIDFDHKGESAAAIPIQFYWNYGIRLEVEWTEAGAAALRGRTYSYFSPEFTPDASGHPVAIPDKGPIGALVNTPAFQSIQRLSAAGAR